MLLGQVENRLINYTFKFQARSCKTQFCFYLAYIFVCLLCFVETKLSYVKMYRYLVKAIVCTDHSFDKTRNSVSQYFINICSSKIQTGLLMLPLTFKKEVYVRLSYHSKPSASNLRQRVYPSFIPCCCTVWAGSQQ